MKQELQAILNEWDYDQGLKWFRAHVEGKFFLKELFGKGNDPYNSQKLRQELTQILDQLTEASAVDLPKANPKKTEELPLLKLPREVIQEIKPGKVVEKASMSPQEWELDQEWKPLYRQAMYRRSQLNEDMSEEQRKEIAYEVLDLMDQVQEIWQKKDFLRKYGQLPEYKNPGLEGMDILALSTRKRTLRTYLSKAAKGILKKDRIPEWEAEIQEIERRMKG
jgi:hypothetical protein